MSAKNLPQRIFWLCINNKSSLHRNPLEMMTIYKDNLTQTLDIQLIEKSNYVLPVKVILSVFLFFSLLKSLHKITQ